MLAWRRALLPDEAATRSARIHERFWSLDALQACDLLLSYVAFDNEVETLPLLSEAHARGMLVLAPACRKGGLLAWGEMPGFGGAHPQATSQAQGLRRTRRGILEPPRASLKLPAAERVVCVTPGIAFTPAGYRLGYGGGYYDRFLPELRRFYGSRVTAVGLAYAFQLVPELPREAHDQSVELVLTEDGCYGAGAEICSSSA